MSFIGGQKVIRFTTVSYEHIILLYRRESDMFVWCDPRNVYLCPECVRMYAYVLLLKLGFL